MVAIDDANQRRKQHFFDNNATLQVTLPQGVYYRGKSSNKAALGEPAFWGYHDTNLRWSLEGGVPKRKLRVKLGIACTSETAAMQQVVIGVSVSRVDGQGNPVCASNATAQVRDLSG